VTPKELEKLNQQLGEPNEASLSNLDISYKEEDELSPLLDTLVDKSMEIADQEASPKRITQKDDEFFNMNFTDKMEDLNEVPTQEVNWQAIEEEEWLDHLYRLEIDDPNDPHFIAKEAHNDTLMEMREELCDALQKRKDKVLELAVAIFNEQQAKYITYNKFEFNLDGKEMKNAGKVLKSIEKFVNHKRSPLQSALMFKAEGILPKELRTETDREKLMHFDHRRMEEEQMDLYEIRETLRQQQSTLNEI